MEGKIAFKLKTVTSSEVAAKDRNTDSFFFSSDFIFQGLPGEIGVSGKIGPPGPAVSVEELLPLLSCSP